MALTIEQHKAAVDDAYPTPPVDWARQDDHLNFSLHEVASVRLLFNGQTHLYLGSHWQQDGAERWEISRRAGRERQIVVRGEVSWGDATAAFETHWEAHCEGAAGIAGSVGLRQGRG